MQYQEKELMKWCEEHKINAISSKKRNRNTQQPKKFKNRKIKNS